MLGTQAPEALIKPINLEDYKSQQLFEEVLSPFPKKGWDATGKRNLEGEKIIQTNSKTCLC